MERLRAAGSATGALRAPYEPLLDGLAKYLLLQVPPGSRSTARRTTGNNGIAA